MGQAITRVMSVLNPLGTPATPGNGSTLPNSPEDAFGSEDVVIGGIGAKGSGSNNSGSFFGTHFLMGGERYDVAKPDAYLFGDNSDLELLGSKPVKFPYNINKGVTDSVGVLYSLINIRRDSIKLLRKNSKNVSSTYRLEFVFDCDSSCYIQIHFCAKEIVDSESIQIVSKYPSIDSSEKFYYEAGADQLFDKYFFKSHRYDLKMMHYEGGQYFPVVIEIRTIYNDSQSKFMEQVQTTMCSIERSADQSALNSLILKPLKQKLITQGVSYLVQEIFGLENKEPDSKSMDENGAECIICMANPRDTVILPCRHLCICNGCAETLRYKLNNCPICRSPFKALLRLKLARAGGQPIPGGGGSITAATINSTGTSVRLRQEILTLIEALNGPYNSEHRASISNAAYDGDKSMEIGPILENTQQHKSSFVERIKNKEIFVKNYDEGLQIEQIELENMGPIRRKDSESSRISVGSTTRVHITTSSSLVYNNPSIRDESSTMENGEKLPHSLPPNASFGNDLENTPNNGRNGNFNGSLEQEEENPNHKTVLRIESKKTFTSN